MRVGSFRFKYKEGEPYTIHLVPAKKAENKSKEKPLPDHIPIKIDPKTGELYQQESQKSGFLDFVFHLHFDLFLGQVGTYLLGFVGLALLFLTVTGVILYGSYMKKLLLGAIRTRSLNLVASDAHKMVGVLSFGFQALIAFTGICLTLGKLVIQLYVYFELQGILELAKKQQMQLQVQNKPVALASIDAVLENGRKQFQTTGENITNVIYPGSIQGDYHFLVLGEAKEGLAKFIPKPLLMNRSNGSLVQALQLPWYIKLIALAGPFHFGNFGGWPVKIIYCILSFATGALAITGYIMYFIRRPHRKQNNKEEKPEEKEYAKT